MRLETPKVKSKSKILQADNRGRIVLPQEIRKFGLFELEPDSEMPGHYHLYPLQTKRLTEGAREAVGSETVDWKRRYDHLHAVLIPGIRAVSKSWNDDRSLKKKMMIQATILFGSYARKDAFQNSDLDLAVFVAPFPKFSERNEIQDFFERNLENELSIFRALGARCDLSLVFVTEASRTAISPLSFSIAEEGFEIFSSGNFFSEWEASVRETMKNHSVLALGAGRNRIWKWNRHENS